MLDIFKEFIEDESAEDMFIVGSAGTGKTTGLHELVEYCSENEIAYKVCAYTHKACGVLRDKLPKDSNISTLHSLLIKRPSLNKRALKSRYIEQSFQYGEPEKGAVLFIDEFSMVGKSDFTDLKKLSPSEDLPLFKIVWIGDMNQLPPVKDAFCIKPYGKYNIKLTKVYRQAEDNPLMEPLNQLVTFLEGKKIEPLIESKNFVRQLPDLETAYLECDEQDKVLLCYTNRAVQESNSIIESQTCQGHNEHKSDRAFDIHDSFDIDYDTTLFSASSHNYYTFNHFVQHHDLDVVHQHWGEDLVWDSKFKTLEYMTRHDLCQFFNVTNEEDETLVCPVIFGTYNFKLAKEEAANEAIKYNKIIAKMGYEDIVHWAKNNYNHEVAIARRAAWRKYLVISSNVMCIDFKHAMTIHKAQGSTYNTVFLNAQDLKICKAKGNYDMYLRLFYVALSRASNCVFTN